MSTLSPEQESEILRKIESYKQAVGEFSNLPESSHRYVGSGHAVEQSFALARDDLLTSELPGYFIFQGDTRCFLFDENTCAFFGLPYNNEWISEMHMLSRFSLRDVERYFKVMDSQRLGDIIFEQITITQGDNKGKQYVVNGSVISRFTDGRVRCATGMISPMTSSFSEMMTCDLTGDGMFSWDIRSREITFSNSYYHMLGYQEGEIPTDVDEWNRLLVHPDDQDIISKEANVMVSPLDGDNFEFCVRVRHRGGDYKWCMGRGAVLSRDETGHAIKILGMLSDINGVQENFDHIKELLYTDTLTGLKNRAFFLHHEHIIQEQWDKPLSIIYIDITGLKITNDVLGHADGDILILSLTSVLRSVLPAEALIVRLSGDEFIVLLSNMDYEACCKMQNTIERAMKVHNDTVKNHNSLSSESIPIFAGLGCATLGEVENDRLSLCIERADERMQQNKDNRRDKSYAAIKAYLEKRMGRPVSMRDSRRLSYLTEDQRAHIRSQFK